TYERLAPSFGYQTRKASAVPWSEVPEANKRLMVAVAAAVRPLIEAEARADERRKIAAALRAHIRDVPTVRPWLDRHRLGLGAGVGAVIASIAHDIEQGDL